MYLFPHPAPDLQIEILDAEHKSEHILFANRQKEHNFYLWHQNQDLFWRSWNRSRLAPQFQWSCTEWGIFHIMRSCAFYFFFCLFFFLSLITLKCLYRLHLRRTFPNLHNNSFLCAHNNNKPTNSRANKPHWRGKSLCSEDAATPRNRGNPGWLLLWLFFFPSSIGAGDPPAKKKKRPGSSLSFRAIKQQWEKLRVIKWLTHRRSRYKDLTKLPIH